MRRKPPAPAPAAAGTTEESEEDREASGVPGKFSAELDEIKALGVLKELKELEENNNFDEVRPIPVLELKLEDICWPALPVLDTDEDLIESDGIVNQVSTG